MSVSTITSLFLNTSPSLFCNTLINLAYQTCVGSRCKSEKLSIKEEVFIQIQNFQQTFLKVLWHYGCMLLKHSMDIIILITTIQSITILNINLISLFSFSIEYRPHNPHHYKGHKTSWHPLKYLLLGRIFQCNYLQ